MTFWKASWRQGGPGTTSWNKKSFLNSDDPEIPGGIFCIDGHMVKNLCAWVENAIGGMIHTLKADKWFDGYATDDEADTLSLSESAEFIGGVYTPVQSSSDIRLRSQTPCDRIPTPMYSYTCALHKD